MDKIPQTQSLDVILHGQNPPRAVLSLEKALCHCHIKIDILYDTACFKDVSSFNCCCTVWCCAGGTVIHRWQVLHWVDYGYQHAQSARWYSQEATRSSLRLRNYCTDGI